MSSSLVHCRSEECTKSELDIFSAPPTQASMESGRWEQYPPVNSPSEGGSLEFFISGGGDSYTDLLYTHLCLKARIVKGDGTVLQATDLVGPTNYWLHSLFSQVELTLNGTPIGHMNNLYPYRAMIEILTNYGANANSCALQAALFRKDSAGSMDVADPTALGDKCEGIFGFDDDADIKDFGNKGLNWRWRFTKNSAWVDLVGPIHHDFFMQERYLINGVDMQLKFTRTKSEFALMSSVSNANYKIEIQDATLFVRKVKLVDHVFLAHQETLLHHNAIYPLSHVVVKSTSIPKGNLTGPTESFFIGHLPSSIVVAFVDNDALAGSYKKNPYTFRHLKMSYFAVRYAGVLYPQTPLATFFDDGNSGGGGQYVRAFHTLFTGNGKQFSEHGSLIKREEFSRGYALYCFDFRPDIGCRGQYSLKRQGTLQLEIRFSEPLPQTVNIIVYAEFDSYVEIAHTREVIVSN